MSRINTTLGLLLLILSGVSYANSPRALAQVESSATGVRFAQSASIASASALGEWSFWPPEEEGAPQRTASGASRNGCTADSVIPLLPESQYGLTGQANPSILAYVTKADVPRQLMFSLKSADGYYYETTVEAPAEVGIIKVALPEEAPALTPDTLYQWSLIVICDNNLRPDSPSLQGWLETGPDLEAVTATMPLSLDQATLYREQHFWYDMIALLAELKSQNPEDAAVHQAWSEMLTATGLEVAAAAPIVSGTTSLVN